MNPEALSSDRGALLPWFALLLPVLMLFMVFVVDVGNWFEHKRHLQLQADAGALAGGPYLTNCPNPVPATLVARRYAGDPGAAAAYNEQVGGASRGDVTVLINSKTYAASSPPPDDTGDMCETMTLDVKITEANVPLFFRIPGLSEFVPAINARARVQARAVSSFSGALPIAAPDVDPTQVTAVFVDEATGTEIGRKTLSNTGIASGLSIWDNTAEPLPVDISSDRIGVRVIMSFAGSSTTCGDPTVACYDAGSANGLGYIRGYPTTGSGAAPNPPIARDVTLFPGTCVDPYFTSLITSCTVGVSADVDFGVANPNSVAAKVFARVNGVARELKYDNPSKRWVSNGTASFPYFTVPAAAGPLPVELSWEVQKTDLVIAGNTCSNKNSNPCKGSFGNVQRVFSATDSRSGPVKLLQVWEGGNFWANSFPRGTTRNLVTKIGLLPDLRNATSVADPIVTLRVVGGSQNQSLDCDPGYPNLKQEIALGCRPSYTQNPGVACPATPPELWATAQPWNCVAIQTGSATNQVAEGLNRRVLGDEKPATCTAPNRWSFFPNIDPSDPRILNVFITQYGAFDGSGSGTTPVLKFGTFYITGWTAAGGGFANPCQGNGDDPVPGGNPGNIVGHFIKYVGGLNNGGASEDMCSLSAFEPCVAVLTE